LSACVCVSVTFVISAETAEPIEMPFGADKGGPEEPCIRCGPDTQAEGTISGGYPDHRKAFGVSPAVLQLSTRCRPNGT